MTKPVSTAIISSTLTKHGQSAILHDVIKTAAGDKLQIHIKSDSYADQSHAYIDRWDGAKWQRVFYIEPIAMQTPTSLAYRQGPLTLPPFMTDYQNLLNTALAIIGE